jgi:hypothetical protein
LTETLIQPSNEEFAALEAFVVENPELQELERQIAPFNIFEALGLIRQELRLSGVSCRPASEPQPR